MNQIKPFYSNRLVIFAIALVVTLIQGCSGDNDNRDIPDTALIRSDVTASSGGTFTTADSSLSVVIPAGALSADTELVVTSADVPAAPSGNLASAGESFDIVLDADILAPIELRFAIDDAPTHPELGESAYWNDGGWVRSSSNFFRASDNTVVSLVSQDGIFQPVLRTLQAESGDSVERGREVFLYESFGNENFFSDVIGLPTLLNNLAPVDAVGVGVQVDIARVPQAVADVLLGDDFAAKGAALQNPAVTRALLKAEAVVGVTATFADEESDTVVSAGITCALCHAVVTPTEFELSENVMTPLPIGQLQLNGVPNTQMDVGTILSLTPFAQNAGAEVISFLQGFGPGGFDPRALPDNPLEDNVLNPTSNPPLWNFVDLAEQEYKLNWDGQFTSTEDPDNAVASRAEVVYDLIMHANGAFGTESSTVPAELSAAPSQAELDSFAAAEANDPGNDIGLQELLDVQAWQRSIVSPPPGDFDESLAEEGFKLFNSKAQCIDCHATAEFTGPVVSADIVLVPPQGGLAGGIKTPGLRGLKDTAPYFHDNSAPTLMDVMDIYSGRIVTELTENEKLAVVEYLNSL